MVYLEGVATLEYDASLCVGCNRCIEVCPHGVVVTDFKKIKIINKDKCIECGACQMNCPTNALQVRAGVGCALAIMSRYFKTSKWLKAFASKDCC